MKPSPLLWPPDRPRNRFPETPRTSVSLATAIPHLLRELDLLGAIRVVITSNAKLKRDGLPYSQQPKSISDTGVAVWFSLTGNKATYCLPCDTVDSIGGNMREIGLAVAELRGFTRRMRLSVSVALAPFEIDNEPAAPAITVQYVTPKKAKPDRPAARPPEPGSWRAVLGLGRVCQWSDVLEAYQRQAAKYFKGANLENRDKINEIETAYQQAKKAFRIK